MSTLGDGSHVLKSINVLKILYFNAQSLKRKGKFDELLVILAKLPDLDVITVVETWFTAETEGFLNCQIAKTLT